ncbi:TPA: HNH endonuclease [Escherichia coli]|uniref:HNH endonuclease signature motif containing protein n=1 Tax=Escherichia coli TaxID=562 RepID=UPI0017651655|nr:HNH endonuclease [Escherichia coli]
MKEIKLTPEMVLSVVDYNPSSGDFHWKWRRGRERTTLTWNSRFAFKKCSSISSGGYLMIMLNGKAYPAHRLAWLIVYGTMPDGIIDHINRVRTDNRISNLRLVTHSENMQNRKIQKNNKSGYRGVSWDAKYGKWRARINAYGKCINLGYHDTAELASATFEAARMKYHTV